MHFLVLFENMKKVNFTRKNITFFSKTALFFKIFASSGGETRAFPLIFSGVYEGRRPTPFWSCTPPSLGMSKLN